MTSFFVPSCYHIHQIPFDQFLNCTLCGTILSSPDSSAKHDFAIIKDSSFNSRADVSPALLYASMLKNQNALRHYNPNAKYLAYRKELVHWLRGLNSQLHLSKATLHIGVAYLDYVLGKEMCEIAERFVVALSCLLLAAKYDELDRNIPPLSKFLYAAKLQSIRASDIEKCEAKILDTLSWNLHIATSLNFLEMLLTQGVLHESDAASNTSPADNKQCAHKELARTISQSALAFADQTLDSSLS